MSLTLFTENSLNVSLCASPHNPDLPDPVTPGFSAGNAIGFMNGDIQYTLRLFIDIFIKMSICVVGFATNIINIVVFLQIGLKDSVTVSFFSLSFADLGFLLFTFSYQLAESLDIISGLKPEVDLRSLAFILNLCSFFFVDMSVLITVFTAIQKCACVAIPFLFKNIFTRALSSCVVIVIYLVMLLYYVPIFVSCGLIHKFDIVQNRTRLKLPLSNFQVEMLAIFTIFNRMVIPFSSMVLVTASLVVMTVKLVDASKLRRSMTTAETAMAGSKTTNLNQLSLNELRAIQAVFLVSAIFVTCNLPDTVSFLVGFLSQDVDSLSFRLIRAVQNVLVVTNATVNMLVYCNYNSKYRSQLAMGCVWIRR